MEVFSESRYSQSFFEERIDLSRICREVQGFLDCRESLGCGMVFKNFAPIQIQQDFGRPGPGIGNTAKVFTESFQNRQGKRVIDGREEKQIAATDQFARLIRPSPPADILGAIEVLFGSLATRPMKFPREALFMGGIRNPGKKGDTLSGFDRTHHADSDRSWRRFEWNRGWKAFIDHLNPMAAELLPVEVCGRFGWGEDGSA